MEEPEKIVSQTELDDKAQKLVEEKDADSRLRVYVGPMEKALTAVLLIWAVFQVWANMFGTLGAVKLRTAHIMFLLPLAFTLYPTFKKERRRRRLMPVWDIALIAAAILSYGYLFMRYDAIARTGRLNSTDVWVGVVCLVVAFEAARRASGNLAIIALIFLSYFAVWGRYIPGTFGTSAFTLKRVIKALVWDTNGVLGTGAGVSATYIVCALRRVPQIQRIFPVHQRHCADAGGPDPRRPGQGGGYRLRADGHDQRFGHCQRGHDRHDHHPADEKDGL